MRPSKITPVIILFLFVLGFKSHSQHLDIQGHRGARGLLPENTINGFIKAVDLGVTTLELDVVVSKDNQIVVSHEAYLSSAICVDPQKKPIDPEVEKSLNIYKMDYEEVVKYDCGIIGNPRFANQEKVSAHKPLLKEVVEVIDKHIKENNLQQVNYNIEIKCFEKGDNIFHPIPAKFSDLVYNEVKRILPMERVTIQSFDLRVLKYLHEKDPGLTLAFLVENKLNYKSQLKKLGFNPAIYSPYFKLLDSKVITKLQNKGIKVIPWTVNDPAEMKILVDWGVDGLITDYPDRAIRFKK